ncbi:hypothetical protein E5678_08745 [Hydrogenophaga sp. PAMC20947]|nr:hypothetical protein E5678_08745 [Hydrogenophaga sp. PAMC20947]
MNWKTLVFAALIGFGLIQHLQTRPVEPGQGVVAPDLPRQVDQQAAALQLKGYTLQPLQKFSVEARVLGTERYSIGREAELSPLDLALGWGQMSDSAVLEKIKISQSNRFYFWRVDEFPIPRRVIERSSANMHMIPANVAMARGLKSVRVGQVVRIDGWLVEAQASDGWRWRSSLSRDDSGAGGCEIVLVQDLQIL